MNNSLLYIGNKIKNHRNNPTTHTALKFALEQEGFHIFSASSRSNKIIRFLEMTWIFLKYFSQVRYVLIDVYSTQNFWYAVWIAFLSTTFQKKYIPILHGGSLPVRFKNSPKFSEYILKNSHKIVSPSQYLKETVQNMGYEKVLFIPNPFHIENYQFHQRENFKPKLLWVRAFDNIYNPLLAIKVTQLLQENYPHVELCMVGPEKDNSLAECKNLAQTNNLNVFFKGKLNKDIWQELAKDYDVFLNTSTIDNIPVSLLEAQALGIPVVSTNVGGIPYIIENNITGKLVPNDNEKDMAAAVREILRDRDLACSMIENARIQMEKLDWERNKWLWLQVLN